VLVLALLLGHGGWKRVLTLLPKAAGVNPGGSGMLVFLGFVIGGLLRSRTHCGGGGGGPAS
jgi:hypothetical protein